MRVRDEDVRVWWEGLSLEQREEIITWVNDTFGWLAGALREAIVWVVQVLEKLAS